MSCCINLRKFECPVCYELILPPVYQCHNGHLICKECAEKISSCPTCRDPMSTDLAGRIRNLELDKIIREQVHSCPYEGCKEKSLKVDEYTEHKKNCVFRTEKFCSLLGIVGCEVETPLNKLPEHLRGSHSASLTAVSGGGPSEKFVTFKRNFVQENRGTYVCFCAVKGRNKQDSEKISIALVESWQDGLVYWSPIFLASPAFIERFVCDIRIRPASAGSAADAPMISFQGVVAHCPESAAWDVEQDYSTTMRNLKKIGDACTSRGRYEVEVRLYEKNEGRFYEFQVPPADDQNAAAMVIHVPPADDNATERVAHVPPADDNDILSVQVPLVYEY